jgi:hypothetical protein
MKEATTRKRSCIMDNRREEEKIAGKFWEDVRVNDSTDIP